MKLHVTKLPVTIGAIAAMVIFSVIFAACESEIVDIYVPAADLVSLRVVVGSGEVVMQGDRIPSPIAGMDWDDEDLDLFDLEFTTLSLKQEADFIDARFYPSVSRDAKVKWGVANRTTRPNKFDNTNVPADFDERDFIYFEVTSGDGKITNYYRFSTYLYSPVKELTSIGISGREANMGQVFPAEVWNGDTLQIGDLNVIEAQARQAVIDAVPWDVTASLRYAVTPYVANVSGRQEPVFGTSNTLAFEDGNLLYVEVTAENTLDINIYAFRVYVGRIATVSKLTFTGITSGAEADSISAEALGKGTAINQWTVNSGAGSFNSPYQPQSGFKFEIELDEPNGRWQYAKISSLPTSNAAEPAWITPANNAAIEELRFENNEYLAIKVIPPNRQGSRPDYFYKVKVGLLAAEFTVQPQPAVYDVDSASVTALGFTLDRTLPNAKYQWYEANSWYGGYGFDSEGRIGERGTLVAEPNWGNNDKGILEANGTVTYYTRDQTLPNLTQQQIDAGAIRFDVSEWYQKSLDEKDNVSLHNGGNSYYNLPIPGRPIPGATKATYEPPVSSTAALGSGQNRRPFITGFSNESHYYWVVVTDPDTGLKATSARAVVVTEWRVRYHNGHESPYSPTDPPPETTGLTWEEGNAEIRNKKHYIFDLYAYQRPGDPGLQAPPRNVIPFKDGNHRDQYYIPVTFPDGFNILEYSVFTAQALFYLADGREWIQNWTQGDIGFARTKEGGVKGNPNDIEEIVLWYNITNDNATRGLQSSGNEPSGGGLSELPEYIVVKPAGTKPLKQMPPFQDGQGGRPGPTYDSVGRVKPFNNNNAQGWFTPYIELCEVRFEGPTRIKDCGCEGKKEDCQCADCECTYCEEESDG